MGVSCPPLSRIKALAPYSTRAKSLVEIVGCVEILPFLWDPSGNPKVIAACLEAAHELGLSRLSAYVVKDGLLDFFTTAKLYPPGLRSESECIQEWGLKTAHALKNLAAALGSLQLENFAIRC